MKLPSWIQNFINPPPSPPTPEQLEVKTGPFGWPSAFEKYVATQNAIIDNQRAALVAITRAPDGSTMLEIAQDALQGPTRAQL